MRPWSVRRSWGEISDINLLLDSARCWVTRAVLVVHVQLHILQCLYADTGDGRLDQAFDRSVEPEAGTSTVQGYLVTLRSQIDVAVNIRAADGEVTALEMTSLDEDEEIEFGAVIGGLLGAG